MERLMISFSVTLFIAGCEEIFTSTHHHFDMKSTPSASEILVQNKHADIFQLNIYGRTSNDMIHQYEKGMRIGKITKRTKDGNKFSNGTANKLPVGTNIYQTVGIGLSVLMVEVSGEKVIYIALFDTSNQIHHLDSPEHRIYGWKIKCEI